MMNNKPPQQKAAARLFVLFVDGGFEKDGG
jgi:hypothetical protein